MRILDFKSSIQNKGFWQHFLDQNILNLISVAIHYSQRYDNSEEYLQNKIEDKETILFFKNNTKNEILEIFKYKFDVSEKTELVDDMIKKEDMENELYYLWQLFLIEENIPCIFETKKEFLKSWENIKGSLNIWPQSELSIARQFNSFWKECIKEDTNEMIEISEIFYFLSKKQILKNHLNEK